MKQNTLVFTKFFASVFMMEISKYLRMLWRWIAINCKVPLCREKQVNPKKPISTAFQHSHKKSCWNHLSDPLINAVQSVDEDEAEDYSVMLTEVE